MMRISSAAHAAGGVVGLAAVLMFGGWAVGHSSDSTLESVAYAQTMDGGGVPMPQPGTPLYDAGVRPIAPAPAPSPAPSPSTPLPPTPVPSPTNPTPLPTNPPPTPPTPTPAPTMPPSPGYPPHAQVGWDASAL